MCENIERKEIRFTCEHEAPVQRPLPAKIAFDELRPQIQEVVSDELDIQLIIASQPPVRAPAEIERFIEQKEGVIMR